MSTYAYVRVSTVNQAENGESLAVQQRQITGYALMHGLDLTATFVEEGVSGSLPVEERPQGARLIGRLQKGDLVIAAKLDRLFRSALDALKTVDAFRAKGVGLHLIDLGGDVLGNGLSKLFLTVAAAFAEAERDRIRERISQVKADQKARGRYLGGRIPFGYRKTAAGDMVEDATEQSAIRDMLRLEGEGLALRAIAAKLNASGVMISHMGVQNILARAKEKDAA